MIADRLLSRLDHVRETGQNRWIARCPAHDDKRPSLSIRESEDRMLLHCWAGCSVYDVLATAGLEISDLYPPRTDTHHGPISRPWPAADILRALASDCIFITVCAGDLAKGEKLEQEDKDRLVLIAARFQQALQAGGITA